MQKHDSKAMPSLATPLGDIRESIIALQDHEDLFRLFDTLNTLSNVLNSLGQHPRFWLDRSMEFTPAGKVMEALGDAIDFLLDDVAKHAKALPAPTKFDRDMKALTLVNWEVFCRSTPVEIVAVAAPLATETH